MTPALWIAAKELRTAFRDRQTLLYAVVLPLAMYPVLFWVILQGVGVLQGKDARTPVVVGLTGTPAGADLGRVEATLGREERAPGEPWRSAGPVEVVRVDPARAASPEAARAWLSSEVGGRAPDALLAFGAADADGFGPALFLDAARPRAALARDRLQERLGALAAELRTEALERPFEDLAPFRLVSTDAASARDIGGFVLSMILPMTLVFMAVLGAFHPAVDVTAGEHERKTEETTLCLPVPRSAIHGGKILAVAASSALATVLNLFGMAFAAEHVMAQLPGKGFTVQIPWGALLAVLPVAGTFLLSSSAILFAAASLTRTFKQGQSLLGTLQLVFLVPAMAGTMPSLELTPALALVPVLQTVLAIKALLQTGTAPDLFALGLVVASQLVYAALALRLSLSLASREDVRLEGGLRKRLRAVLRAAGAPR